MGINETVIDVPDSLGIPRINMPQVDREHVQEFLEYLDDQNISYSGFKIPAYKLKATQKEINKEKVLDLLNTPDKIHAKPVIISSNFYILDGHHRAIAQLNLNREGKLVCIKVHQPIKTLLKTVINFPKVKYKKVS